MRQFSLPINRMAVLAAAFVAFAAPAQAQMAGALGKPDRLLVGLGAGNSVADIQSQGIQPDIIDTYLVGVGSGSWTTWNSPSGSYLTMAATQAAKLGAVPMFTL